MSDIYSVVDDGKLVVTETEDFSSALRIARETSSRLDGKYFRIINGVRINGTITTVWSGEVKSNGVALRGIVSHAKFMCGVEWV